LLLNTPYGAVIVVAGVGGQAAERESLRHRPGIRPTIGDMVDSFFSASTSNSRHALQAPGPTATAALAIARRAADEADRMLDLSALRPVTHTSRPSAHR
jgi:hypothetical protein